MKEMTATKDAVASAPDRELVFTRLFDAPRELVFQAWTDPRTVGQWWGPYGFTTTTHEMDVRSGGVWRLTMHGPDGRDYKNKIVFLEVVKPSRLVYKHDPEKGTEPVSFETTVTFAERGDKTELMMRMLFPSAAAREYVIKTYGAEEGAKQTLARLGEHLAKTPLVVERSFNAPLDTVWKAITDVGHMKQWYFAALESFRPEVGFETQFNVEHGGRNFLHIWKVTDVVPGKKITYSWRYGGYPGETFVTFELHSEGQKTKLKLTHDGLESFVPESHPELARENFVQGWTHYGEALEAFLEGTKQMNEQEFTITRVFDAPRELVFKAWTEGERLAHWWGPKGYKIRIAKLDFRPGGVFHYSMTTPAGDEWWGKFVYREIVPPERLVFVNSFSDAQGGVTRAPMSPTFPLEMLSTITFTEHDGQTTVTLRAVPVNASEEESKTFAGMRESMQKGWTGTMDQLAAYLA